MATDDEPRYGVKPSGYRLPAATRVGGVRLQVCDIARSVDYYRHALGFELLSQSGSDAAFAASGSDVPLIRLHEQPGAHPLARSGRLGLYHFALLLPDRPALGRFLTHLREIGVRAATADHDVSEAIYLWDPDGLGIEVYADRPRETWRVRGHELYMSTEPLDVDAVVRAGAGERWPGMPAGTVMGHMHLHVDNLRDAEAFFHRALGFDKTVWRYPGALFLSAGGYHHHIGANIWAAGAPPSRDDDARLLEWEVILPTTEEAGLAASSCTSAGYPVIADGAGWLVTDPSGTRLRVRA